MNKKAPIYIPIDKLADIKYKVELKISGKDTHAYDRSRSIIIKIPTGTLYKINQTLIKNSVGEVYYIQKYKLWYVLLEDFILWSNFKITTKKLKKVSKEIIKKLNFNRYTALIEEKGD